MSNDPEQIASQILDQLEQAWNTADGDAFAAPFTTNADYVAIRGDYHRTRTAIAQGHQHIFDTIYKDSVVRLELLQARRLTDDVIVAHSKSTLNAPSGPLAGEHSAVATLVIVHTGDHWRVEAFHNTLVVA